MARRTKHEAEKTRNAILDAAERVFFKRGVVRTSLQEIAEAAKVTRGAVYWHFANKIELVMALTDRVVLPQEHILEEMENSATKKPLEDMKRACLKCLREMIHDRHRRRVFTILTQRCEYVEELKGLMKSRYEMKKRITGRMERLFAQAQQKEQRTSAWPPYTVAMTLHALMFGLMMGIIISYPEPAAGLEKANAACIASFFSSLKP